jgi:hypothetical protein
MKRARISISISVIPILMGLVFLQFPSHFGEAKEMSSLLQGHPVSEEEISTYTSFIETYVNRNWKKGNQPDSQYHVTLLEITKTQRIDQLRGQYNYCLVMIEFAGEVRECMACFWQPDVPVPEKAFDFKGIYEVARKSVI